MQDIKHCDILWVDDFDKSEKVDNPRRYLKDYFPAEFSFRVRIEKNFFNALVHLEKNFTNYSCVVLDVNFIKGFNLDELNDEDGASREVLSGLESKKIRFEGEEVEDFENLEDDEKDIIKAAVTLQRLYEILKGNNIMIDGALDAENLFADEVIDFEKISKMIEAFNRDDNDFKKNAGYYLFLYLLQRGMPQKNIAMLTGNKGETSVKWEKKFSEANLQSPKAFDRMQCVLTKKVRTSEFVDWLDEVFNPPYRLRACMVAMTAILQKMLNDENIKRKLVTANAMWTEKDSAGDYRSSAVRNFHPEYIPFRLPEDKKISAGILFHFISQVVIPWDKSLVHKCSNNYYPYYATMKTARNWLAHRVIQNLTLQTESFLLGVCMRGLFNFSSVNPKTLSGYEEWENDLLNLITELDNEINPTCIDGVSSLVIPSSKEFSYRSNYKQKQSENQSIPVHNVLSYMGDPEKNGAAQSTNAIKCYEDDLLRAFLHGVYGYIPSDNLQKNFLTASEKTLEKDIRGKFLKAIKNRLKKAVDEAGKSGRKD